MPAGHLLYSMPTDFFACWFIICVIVVVSLDRYRREDKERAARRGRTGRMIEGHVPSLQQQRLQPHKVRLADADAPAARGRSPREPGDRKQAAPERRRRARDLGGSMSQLESSQGERMCKAAAIGDLRSLRTLIVDKGASVNARNCDGRGALHLAAAEGHQDVVEFLLTCRVDVNAQDRWGGTPLQDATRGGHRRVARLLQRAGAAWIQHSWSAKVAEEAYSSQPLQMRAKLGCWAIASDEIDLVAGIGQGGQGKVYRAVWRGMSVVVKAIKKSHVALHDELFENEIMVMSTLRHPNLVLFLGAVFNGPQKMLVTEYLEQGSLLDFYVRMWHTSKAPFLPRVEVLCSSLNSLLLICVCIQHSVPSDLFAV